MKFFFWISVLAITVNARGAFKRDIGESLQENRTSNQSSLADKELQQCLIKFVIEQKLIDLKDVNANPGNISTANIDCNAMIGKEKAEARDEVSEIYKENDVTPEVLECLMRIYDAEKLFEWGLSNKVFGMIEISAADLAQHRGAVMDKLVTIAMAQSEECLKGTLAEKALTTI